MEKRENKKSNNFSYQEVGNNDPTRKCSQGKNINKIQPNQPKHDPKNNNLLYKINVGNGSS